MKFYLCNNCNQVHIKVIDNDIVGSCCDEKLQEIIPNFAETEKSIHMPRIRQTGNFVKIIVGEDEHPMVDIHYISFILLETNLGVQYKRLDKKSSPSADFIIANNEEIVNVYIYCTLHSLWSLN